MQTVCTSLFDLVSPADPARVWAALTRPDLTSYLFGLQARSSWEPGAPVVFVPAASGTGQTPLRGEVLLAEASHRLSYSMTVGDSHPITYVTWEITDGRAGSRVRLYVDEASNSLAECEEGAAAWSLVVAGLEKVTSLCVA